MLLLSLLLSIITLTFAGTTEQQSCIRRGSATISEVTTNIYPDHSVCKGNKRFCALANPDNGAQAARRYVCVSCTSSCDCGPQQYCQTNPYDLSEDDIKNNLLTASNFGTCISIDNVLGKRCDSSTYQLFSTGSTFIATQTNADTVIANQDTRCEVLRNYSNPDLSATQIYYRIMWQGPCIEGRCAQCDSRFHRTNVGSLSSQHFDNEYFVSANTCTNGLHQMTYCGDGNKYHVYSGSGSKLSSHYKDFVGGSSGSSISGSSNIDTAKAKLGGMWAGIALGILLILIAAAVLFKNRDSSPSPPKEAKSKSRATATFPATTPAVVGGGAAAAAATTNTNNNDNRQTKEMQPMQSSSSALPAGWEEAVDENGAVYYYCPATNETSWEKPGQL